LEADAGSTGRSAPLGATACPGMVKALHRAAIEVILDVVFKRD